MCFVSVCLVCVCVCAYCHQGAAEAAACPPLQPQMEADGAIRLPSLSPFSPLLFSSLCSFSSDRIQRALSLSSSCGSKRTIAVFLLQRRSTALHIAVTFPEFFFLFYFFLFLPLAYTQSHTHTHTHTHTETPYRSARSFKARLCRASLRFISMRSRCSCVSVDPSVFTAAAAAAFGPTESHGAKNGPLIAAVSKRREEKQCVCVCVCVYL